MQLNTRRQRRLRTDRYYLLSLAALVWGAVNCAWAAMCGFRAVTQQLKYGHPDKLLPIQIQVLCLVLAPTNLDQGSTGALVRATASLLSYA